MHFRTYYGNIVYVELLEGLRQINDEPPEVIVDLGAMDHNL